MHDDERVTSAAVTGYRSGPVMAPESNKCELSPAGEILIVVGNEHITFRPLVLHDRNPVCLVPLATPNSP